MKLHLKAGINEFVKMPFFFNKNFYYAKIGVNRSFLGQKSIIVRLLLNLIGFSEVAPDNGH